MHLVVENFYLPLHYIRPASYLEKKMMNKISDIIKYG